MKSSPYFQKSFKNWFRTKKVFIEDITDWCNINLQTGTWTVLPVHEDLGLIGLANTVLKEYVIEFKNEEDYTLYKFTWE